MKFPGLFLQRLKWRQRIFLVYVMQNTAGSQAAAYDMGKRASFPERNAFYRKCS